ncbi:MAG: ATP-binding cassette domain-containing protein [Patescibacteria group bacterium]
MAPQIHVSNLTRVFRSRKKEEGFLRSVISLFAPKYNEKHAVKNVSFDIEKGELVGFIGANGAGKTTTLKMLSGLLYPTSGSIRIMGFEPFKRDKEFLINISLLMGQRRQLWWDLPVIDSLKLNKEIYEISDREFKKILDELTDIFHAGKLLDQPARTLSLGERMKCELIASILHKPKILFLDEPTIGLDIVMQRQVRQFVKDFNTKYESTIILTSHYMDDVKELCKRVLIINSGELVYDGALADITKSIADFKLLTVTFNDSVSKEQLFKYGYVESYSPTLVTIKVPNENVRNTSSIIMSEMPVEDVTINEPTIEDVIRGIFAKR